VPGRVRQSFRRRWSFVFAALLAAILSPPAHAANPPTSVVAMGDSYISGEAGRWLGNSADVGTDRDGTDRACVFSLGLCTSYDKGLVYVGGSAADGCHRSDVAEVLSARLPVDRPVNLACSGAVTSDLLRAANGGTRPHGEEPQADQLLPVARATRVRMIVVSVGGNDLKFAPIVQACFTGYITLAQPCSQTQTAALSDAKLAQATTKIEHAIDEIRAVMREAGHADGTYRLVLQTYPVVIPHAADARYPQPDPLRTVDGCPFYNADMDWANDVAAPRIGRAVKAAAAARGAEVLELLRAFAGHEVCARTAAAASVLGRPSPAASEWGRAVSATTILVGETQELFHPNAYGQAAFGRCLSQMYASRRGSYACTGRAGHGPQDMVLAPLRKPIKLAASCRLLAWRATTTAGRASPRRRPARRSCPTRSFTAGRRLELTRP
jgi:lysophospholipase L1-like esterase